VKKDLVADISFHQSYWCCV